MTPRSISSFTWLLGPSTYLNPKGLSPCGPGQICLRSCGELRRPEVECLEATLHSPGGQEVVQFQRVKLLPAGSDTERGALGYTTTIQIRTEFVHCAYCWCACGWVEILITEFDGTSSG